MLPRSRSARIAGLALAATTPFTLAAATPAFAAGGDAVVDATLTAGNVHVESTKGLSRTTVVLCDGSTVVVPSWAGDLLSGDVPVDGPVRAVFVHSGNNTTVDAEALLTVLAGADAVHGNSTGAIAFPKPEEGDPADPCAPKTPTPEPVPDPETPDPTPNTPTPNTPDPTPNTPTPNTPDPTPNTNTTPTPTPDPAPTTSVEGDTLERAQTPAGIPVVVLGETLVAGGELPRTGSGDVQPLMLVALSLVSSGLALRVGSRRIRSASSPG